MMSIEVQVTQNQQQADLKPFGGDDWGANFKDGQEFTISFIGKEVDVNRRTHLGLQQTLRSSTRQGVYSSLNDEDVTLSIVPHTGPPSLDGSNDTRPWYNTACQPLAITTETQTRKLYDAPQSRFARQIIKDAGKPTQLIKTLSKVVVYEEFLLTLLTYDGAPPSNWRTGSTALRQWTWSYGYTLTAGTYTPIPSNVTATTAIPVQAPNIANVVFDGEPAGDDPTKSYAPTTGWQPHYP